MNKGKFTLNESESEYPGEENQEAIDMRGFNAIHIKGSLNGVAVRIHFKGILGSSHLIPEVLPGKIHETIPFPLADNSGYIVFSAEPKKLKTFLGELQFELKNVDSKTYKKICSKDWGRKID